MLWRCSGQKFVRWAASCFVAFFILCNTWVWYGHLPALNITIQTFLSLTQQSQSGPPLCTSHEIRLGSWEPITLDGPPYIPRSSKCYSKEQLENATEWKTYQWHPQNAATQQCEFAQWDADLFCRVANNKTIALGGDSLT
jgi:hypothetical protein